MAFVYIIELSDKTCYCGISKNVVRRLIDHGKGRSKSTRNKRPHTIKFVRSVEDMKEARQMEVMIKKQGVARWCVKNKYKYPDIVPMITDDIKGVYNSKHSAG